MKAKLIITDLDGTALDSPREKLPGSALTHAVAGAHKAGIRISVATGRPFKAALPVLKAMNVTDPVIVSGGTRIVDPLTGNELWGLDVPAEAIKQVIKAAKKYDIKYLWNDYTEQQYIDGGWDIAELTDIKDIYFFELCYMIPEEAKELAHLIKDVEGIIVEYARAYQPGTVDIHIINKAATKEHALYELQEMLGIPIENTVGIGDGPNDIHLFNAVAHKVAVANAVPELKEKAHQVIGDVNDDGLAKFIEEITAKKGEI